MPASARPAWWTSLGPGPGRGAPSWPPAAMRPVDGGGLPYGPVVGILPRPGASDRRPHRRRSRSPRWAGPTGGAGRPTARSTDELAKTRLFESILSCRRRTGRARAPIVLVVRGPALGRLGQRRAPGLPDPQPRRRRVLLVGTYRSEELGRRPSAAAVADASSAAIPGSRQSHSAGLDRRRDGRAGRRHPRAAARAGVGRRRVGPVAGQPVLRRGAHRRRAHRRTADRVAGRDARPRRVACPPAATRCCAWWRRRALCAEHRLLVATDLLDAQALDTALAEAMDAQLLVVDPTGRPTTSATSSSGEAVDAATLPGERQRLHRQDRRRPRRRPDAGPGWSRPSRRRAGGPLVDRRGVGRRARGVPRRGRRRDRRVGLP